MKNIELSFFRALLPHFIKRLLVKSMSTSYERYLESRCRISLFKYRYFQKLDTYSSTLRAAIFVPDLSIWDVLAPIYRELVKHNNVTVDVFSFQRVDISITRDQKDHEFFFAERGIPFRYLTPENEREIDWKNYDFSVFALGRGAYPQSLKIEKMLRKNRTVYLAYGFLLGNHEKQQFNSLDQKGAWKILAANDFEFCRYQRYAKGYNRVTLVGYTRFEEIEYFQLLRGENKRKQVVWAPHWTVGVGTHNQFGTFDRLMETLLLTIKQNLDIDFWFLPHPNLCDRLFVNKLMSKDDYQIFLDELKALPNTKYDASLTASELIAKSDGMITDSISFLADYLKTTSPLLFLARKDRRLLNEVGEAVIGSHYHAHSETDITNFLDIVRGTSQDFKFNSRQIVFSQLKTSLKKRPSCYVAQLLSGKVSNSDLN